MSHMTSVMYFLFLQKVDPALLFASRLTIYNDKFLSLYVQKSEVI